MKSEISEQEVLSTQERMACLEVRLAKSTKVINEFSASYFGRLWLVSLRMRSLLNFLCATVEKAWLMLARLTLRGKLCAVSRHFNCNMSRGSTVEDLCESRQLDAHKIHEEFESMELGAGGLDITWIVFGYMSKGGGHRNIFRMASHLERFGHRVHMYITDVRYDDRKLEAMVAKDFYPIAGEIKRFKGEIGATDVLIATHWMSVKYVEALKNKAKAICYFVQDYEPLFYPMGSEYLLARETYRKKYQYICSGEWVWRKLETGHGCKGGYFNFPINNAVYKASGAARVANRVIFFAKPEMSRRCFEIGCAVLAELYQLNKNVEILMFGSADIKNHRYDFPVKILSLVPTINDLAEWYRSAAVGLAFSTTNPSLVPYEMMACGVVVADIYTELSEFNYGGSFDIALLCEPDPPQMAKAIDRLLRDPAELARRRSAGLDLCKKFPSELEAARTVEGLIQRALLR